MGDRYRRQVRKEVNKTFEKAVLDLKAYIQKLPFSKRIKLSWNILIHKRLEY